jgi:hypothetical protein
MSESFADAKARVLAALKAAAPHKVSTWTLIHEAHHSRAAGRCWELIHIDRYQIEHTHEGRTHYWKYVGEPLPGQQAIPFTEYVNC